VILGLEPATRYRFAAGSWGSDGRWDEGASTSSAMRVSFQPASQQVLATLPEGERNRDPRMIWTSPSTELRALSQYAGTVADRVGINGAIYEVREVWDYRTTHPIPHCQALLVRYQEPDATLRGGKLEELTQAVREALKVALDLTDAEVICYAAEGGGPRPALPYYAVRVIGDVPTGTDWTLQGDDAGQTTTTAEGNRGATVSVFGYGAATSAGLEAFAASLMLPLVQAELDGFALDPDGAITASPLLLDTGIEQRYQRDFSAAYIQRSTTADLPVAEHLVFDIDLQRPEGGADLNVTVTADAP
jgi:hypothetical protein